MTIINEFMIYPLVVEVLGIDVGDHKELIVVRDAQGKIYEYQLHGTELAGWAKDIAPSIVMGEWIEIGERDDESLYLEMLFTSDGFNAINGVTNKFEYDLEYDAFKKASRLRLVDSPDFPLYYGRLYYG